MSRYNGGRTPAKKAVALRYGEHDAAPVVVASGMGYLAEKIVEVAADEGVPIYEDNSLATALAQLELGREIPENLYQAIVELYVYFLQFDPTGRRSGGESAGQAPAEGGSPAEERTEEEPHGE